jgi:hypothetical protein
MNTTLSTETGRGHPPQQSQSHQPYEAHRVSYVDRIALHLGVALITWGRRPQPVESRERRAIRVERQLARLERERAIERSLRLALPPR